MTRALAWPLAAALLLGFAPPAGAEPPQISDSARAVLEKAIECIGGDEALANVTSMRIVAEGTYTFGEMVSPYTTETVYVAPDKMLWKLDTPGFKGLMAIDGDVAWSQMMTPPARAAGDAMIHYETWLFTFDVMLLRPLLHLEGAKITGGEAEESEGATVHRIHIELANGRKNVLTFSGGERTLLTRIEAETADWGGRPSTMIGTMSGHKPFGDITWPASST
ncbi:MAG: hypothetical protein ACYTG6_13700, partial [Planctomycetota bacterium]